MSTKERKHPAPPRYDEAFKAGAVRMVTEQGRPSREVAAELGICIDTLRSWLNHRRGKQTAKTATPDACANWRRRFEHCARSLKRKTGSLTS